MRYWCVRMCLCPPPHTHYGIPLLHSAILSYILNPLSIHPFFWILHWFSLQPEQQQYLPAKDSRIDIYEQLPRVDALSLGRQTGFKPLDSKVSAFPLYRFGPSYWFIHTYMHIYFFLSTALWPNDLHSPDILINISSTTSMSTKVVSFPFFFFFYTSRYSLIYYFPYNFFSLLFFLFFLL